MDLKLIGRGRGRGLKKWMMEVEEVHIRRRIIGARVAGEQTKMESKRRTIRIRLQATV